MPKSLTEDTGVSSWSRKGTLMSDTLPRSCLIPKKIRNWFEQHQPAMRCRSSVIFTRQEFMFLTRQKGAVDLGIVNVGIGAAGLTAEGRSSIYKLNNKGSKMEP